MTAGVVVFARAPVRGAVKTRLAQGVGDARALEVYRWLGARVVAALAHGPRAYALTVAFTPADAASAVRAWLPGADAYVPQAAGDLGARMASALSAQFAAGHARVLLVGTDCAAVDGARVAAALAALARVPCVLGPAHDGGYYLLGATRALPVFDDVAWSTPAVLPTTRLRLAAAQLAWDELPIERDVDTAQDLAALAALPDAPPWVAANHV